MRKINKNRLVYTVLGLFERCDSIEDIQRENRLIKITIYDNYNLFTVIIVNTQTITTL